MKNLAKVHPLRPRVGAYVQLLFNFDIDGKRWFFNLDPFLYPTRKVVLETFGNVPWFHTDCIGAWRIKSWK